MASDLAIAEAELAPVRGEFAGYLMHLSSIEIESAEELDCAADTLRTFKARGRELDARRREITQPMLVAKASVDELFRPVIGACAQIETLLKRKIAEYTARVEAERRGAMQVLATRIGERAALRIAPPAKAEGVTVRKALAFEVEDASRVPREYCSPDPTLIRTAVQDGARTIPGVRIYEKDQVIARV